MFQLTAARRRLGSPISWQARISGFQLTAARRRLVNTQVSPLLSRSFQLTAARRRLVLLNVLFMIKLTVSTHIRPKAAGCQAVFIKIFKRRFNSQPPEGGWGKQRQLIHQQHMFQLTAARRRLVYNYFGIKELKCFNSQPPEGGWIFFKLRHRWQGVSTHSRPKAAGSAPARWWASALRFNSQPPEGGWLPF